MTQWQKMTPEQRQAQMDRNTYYRHKRKAAELGLSVEEYQKNLSQRGSQKPSKKVKAVTTPDATEEEGWGWIQANNSHMSDEIQVKSELRPWLTFVMKRTKIGEFVGYKTIGTIIDEKLKADLEEKELEL